MSVIISRIMKLLNESSELISVEEAIYRELLRFNAEIMGKILTTLDKSAVMEKSLSGWKRVRADQRTLTFLFGSVEFTHTLMETPEGSSVYPVHELLGLRPHQQYTPAVELKVAELATKQTYRAAASTLAEWTPVSVSPTTVGTILKRVGNAQAESDEAQVKEMEEAASLPEGKQVAFLFAEADGVHIHGTEKKRSHEIHHAILYEGWKKNGKRVSLEEPTAILTTRSSSDFWKEVQVLSASKYSIEKTQVVTNSDGGPGYTSEKFKTAFSQSDYPVLSQLDKFHISQALLRLCGTKEKELAASLRKTIQRKEKDQFILLLDTYESQLKEKKEREKVEKFRSYILNNWDRIFDWRNVVEKAPEGARGTGAMESRNRTVTFRMKRRGMHWSNQGAEAMVKVMQGLLNGTLKQAYSRTVKVRRSRREQRRAKQTFRLAQLMKDSVRPSDGTRKGRITLDSSQSSAMGRLVRSLTSPY